jgi:hypothetical protein
LGQGKVIMDIIALLNPIGAPLVYFPTVFERRPSVVVQCTFVGSAL